MLKCYTSWRQQKIFGVLVFSGLWNGRIDQKWVKRKKLIVIVKLVFYESWSLFVKMLRSLKAYFVGNKAKGWISKRALQENKARNNHFQKKMVHNSNLHLKWRQGLSCYHIMFVISYSLFCISLNFLSERFWACGFNWSNWWSFKRRC